MQFSLDKRQQLFESKLIAVAPINQQRGNVVGGGHYDRFQCTPNGYSIDIISSSAFAEKIHTQLIV